MTQLKDIFEYNEILRELQSLSQESGVKTYEVSLKHLDIEIPDNTRIKETWYTDKEVVVKTWSFPVSMLPEFKKDLREKIKYRRKIIDEKYNKPEGKNEKD